MKHCHPLARALALWLALLCALAILSCGGKTEAPGGAAQTPAPPAGDKTPADPDTPAASGGDDLPAGDLPPVSPAMSGDLDAASDSSSAGIVITLTFAGADGKSSIIEEGEGAVTLFPGREYRAGDKITLTLTSRDGSTAPTHVALSLCEKTGEALLTLPQGELVYTVPQGGKSYLPSAFYNVENIITARIPDEEELAAPRNIACNPYDGNFSEGVFPHASSNNQYNAAEFGAHNVLDGIKRNTGHGTYPYQSWGTAEHVREDDNLTLDFGEEMTLSTLTLYLRADFSTNHDAYFSEVTVLFSDGSSTVIHPVRSSEPQSFDLGGVRSRSLVLTGFVTDKTSGTWAGYTEVEVTGAP